MEKITSKKGMQKIIIAIVIVLSFNFIVPNYSQADWGGVLFNPISDFLSAIGDAVLAALQYFMYDGNVSLKGQSVFSTTIPNTVFYASKYGVAPPDGSEVDVQINAQTLNEPGWWNTLISWRADVESNIFNFLEDITGWGFFDIMSRGTNMLSVMSEASYGIPIVRYSPEEIFSNKVPALDANFIQPTKWSQQKDENGDPLYPGDMGTEMDKRSVALDLHEVVANWYVALRNLAVVLLLSILLYVGIRMVISSAAQDKAKYKKMFMDWFVALCILFFLHYVMLFVLTMVETLVDSISQNNDSIVIGIYTDDTFTTLAESKTFTASDDSSETMQGEPLLFKTDLTGLCRLLIQSKDLSAKLVYLIMFIALVIYTVMFTWTYVKRAITMAFLTLIAPLIAVTYPIDKLKDGSAQGFNIWLKEFIFNAILQPFHLIIYTIFLGSSMEIAIKNPIYAVLFLAFITPSEKLLRKMFGFDGSSTAGSMSTAASMLGGAALLKSAGGIVNKIRGKGGKERNGNNATGRKNVRTKDNMLTDSNRPSLESAFGARGGNRTSGVNNRAMRGNLSNRQGINSNQQMLSQQTQNRRRTVQQANRRALVNGNTRASARNAALANGATNVANAPRRYRIAKHSGANTPTVRQLAAQNPLPQPLPKSKGRPIRGILRATGHVLGGVGKFAGRAGLTAVGLGTGAVLGVAAGITGDDLEDVVTSGVTGTALGGVAVPALGHAVASGATDLVTNRIPNIASGIRDAYEEGAYDPVELALTRQRREFESDEYNRLVTTQDLKQELGREPTSEELKSAMQVRAEYNNLGITNIKDIRKAEKTEKDIRNDLVREYPQMSEDEINSLARARSAKITEIASGLNNKDARDPKELNKIKQGIKEQLFASGKMSDEESEKQADYIIKLVKKQRKL